MIAETKATAFTEQHKGNVIHEVGRLGFSLNFGVAKQDSQQSSRKVKQVRKPLFIFAMCFSLWVLLLSGRFFILNEPMPSKPHTDFPSEIRDLPTLATFTKHLKLWLLKNLNCTHTESAS